LAKRSHQRYAPQDHYLTFVASAYWLPPSQFNHVNNLQLIARAHQLVNEGYKYHFQSQEVVTVWSAPNYCYRCGNVASIMTLGEDLEPDFKIFSAVPDHRRAVPAGRRGAGEYFL
jgi:serine/threonine-protein phosphatase PP1-1